MDKRIRIDELTQKLNEASNAYYSGHDEIMTNYEWDALFDELAALEDETGYINPSSPTQRVGGEEANGVKEPHEYPALSLAKSKKISDLQKWAADRVIWLSWKLDGLTLVATYDSGKLTKLLTRGNGLIGTNITFLAPYIKGLPMSIADKGHLVVRGEAVISNDDFESLNATIDDEDGKYANARNLAAGTMALDPSRAAEVKERNVHLIAFTLIHTDEDIISWGRRMDYLDKLGFETVQREAVSSKELETAIEAWTERVEQGEAKYPVDGLVICYDDTVYAASGSSTGHHETRGGFAFKWQDESAATMLDHIEWSCAASSITPVAVFKPIHLEGTTVSRASMCNISELERLGIGADGETELEVIKANKIIPKVVKVTNRSGTFQIPEVCPVCGAPTKVNISEKSGTKTLHCTNGDCPAKHLKMYARCVGKDGLDIEGLSIKTLAAFVNHGFIHEYADIFKLSQYANDIIQMEGFGERSWNNLCDSIAKSRTTTASRFIYSLNIPMIGRDATKKIINTIGSKKFFERAVQGMSFEDIDGIGVEKSNSIMDWFNNPNNRAKYQNLRDQLMVEDEEPKEISSESLCFGKTFVITGDVHFFKNRNAFKKYVEEAGGKVSGSVSKKTDYLVNNDIESESSKNKKAKELNVPIISEDQFVQQFYKP